MLKGAMEELRLGDPWALATDLGPVIDAAARDGIREHVERARAEGRLLAERPAPEGGTFVGPAVIRVGGIADIEREVFGPVLHVATFPSGGVEAAVEQVDATGYGLTFGLHTRIDASVQRVVERVRAATFTSTATRSARGGLAALRRRRAFGHGAQGRGPTLPAALRAREPGGRAGRLGPSRRPRPPGRALARAPVPPRPEPEEMPGPTGESNRLGLHPRAPLLCLGPGAQAARAQAKAVRAVGGAAVEAEGAVEPGWLSGLAPLGGVLWWGGEDEAAAFERALAAREGPILPLLLGRPDRAHATLERHVCVDTTAAGRQRHAAGRGGRGDLGAEGREDGVAPLEREVGQEPRGQRRHAEAGPKPPVGDEPPGVEGVRAKEQPPGGRARPNAAQRSTTGASASIGTSARARVEDRVEPFVGARVRPLRLGGRSHRHGPVRVRHDVEAAGVELGLVLHAPKREERRLPLHPRPQPPRKPRDPHGLDDHPLLGALRRDLAPPRADRRGEGRERAAGRDPRGQRVAHPQARGARRGPSPGAAASTRHAPASPQTSRAKASRRRAAASPLASATGISRPVRA
jgi:hypothetical protein